MNHNASNFWLINIYEYRLSTKSGQDSLDFYKQIVLNYIHSYSLRIVKFFLRTQKYGLEQQNCEKSEFFML
jgi:hypothetical protein